MRGNDPDFLEAKRLVLKFFPESVGFNTSDVGLDWNAFLGAMMSADYTTDYSCDPFRNPNDPDLGLSEIGGLEGQESEVYLRLLSHTGLNPAGRSVVVPDALGRTGWSIEECPPFVCAVKTVPERLDEMSFFHQSRDSLFVYESGEALLIDHDCRVHWARSQINKRQGKA